MGTAYDAELWEEYGVASAMLSLPIQLIAAYELECFDKESISYIIILICYCDPVIPSGFV